MIKSFKKKFFTTSLLLLCLFIFTEASQAQTVSNAVKINPLNLLILKKFSVAYERALTEQSSAQLQFSYLVWNKTVGTQYGDGDSRLRGVGFMPEFRFYPFQEALNGFYLGPYGVINFNKGEIDVKGDSDLTQGYGETNINIFGLGGLLGYQALIHERVALDFFLGLGFVGGNVNDIEVAYQNGESETVGIGFPFSGIVYPRFGISVGYAF